jgi:hypothetical protein
VENVGTGMYVQDAVGERMKQQETCYQQILDAGYGKFFRKAQF